MFVEQMTKTHRAEIGSMDATRVLRRTANGADSRFVSDTDHIANANQLPVAPINTGILGSTRINTPKGPVAVVDLEVGQKIVTSSGETARLTYVLPADQPKSALRIRAPYFGANQDFILGSCQFLEIRSDVAEYMFGEPCVFVPAWVFKDNSKVLYHELSKSDEMFQIQIDATGGFSIGDCHIAPLLVGPKMMNSRFLNDAEARAFATERRIGQYN